MKKTLAAVLAAMMALSTATVAMAADTHDGSIGLEGADLTLNDTSAASTSLKFDKDYDLFPTLSDGNKYLTNGDMYTLVDNGWLKGSVTVTEGRAKFATIPTLATVSQDVDSDGAKEDALRLRFKIAHTYGTSAVEVGFRTRFTVAKNVYLTAAGEWTDAAKTDDVANTLILKKGDTYVSDDYEVKAEYSEIQSHYDDEMTITEQECKDGFVKVDASDISDITDESVIFYFDDVAAWEGKIVSSQKDFNVFFSTSEIEEIAEAYEDIDFEYITFKGAPSFNRSGSLTFNAIGEGETVVYEYVDGALNELETEYDSTYDIVTVDGVKKLGTYVVAAEAVPMEETEAEPEVEEPAVEEENPNTGAC